MQKKLTEPPAPAEDDSFVSAVIHAGENAAVDRVIGCLQYLLERKVPMVTYARINGADGMQLSRAAFGAMIKFSEYFQAFVDLVDDAETEWEMLKDDAERDIKLREHLKAAPQFEGIQKRWESATKMRQWITEKKKNLIERIRKDVEAEFKKKKEEAKPATDEKKEEAKEPAEEAKPK